MHWMSVELALSEGIICSHNKALHIANDTFCDFTKENGRRHGTHTGKLLVQLVTLYYQLKLLIHMY